MKPLFLDSIIAPSAVNLDFFSKIELLSPFGSGNPEPKFIIENVKTINGKIVGEKHVKSILIGEDGSTIKSIAFNATENELGGYLLKKHNKSFNIAGKLSLNEWRGQSNVEFIIDDISVNKTFKKYGPIVYRLGQLVFIQQRGVRFPLGPPLIYEKNCCYRRNS